MVLKRNFRVLRKYRPRSVLLESKEIADEALLFESGTIACLTPVEVEAIRKEYGETISAYGCLGVLEASEGTDTFLFLVVITDCRLLGKVEDVEILQVTKTAFIPLTQQTNLKAVLEVGKLLASGRFYFASPSFSTRFDLLACAQKLGQEQPQFFWNKILYEYMGRYGVNCRLWLERVLCGSVEVLTVYAGLKQAKACLISRLSCERAGTRLQTRGTDDDGHVANFVETEEALYVDGNVTSFVQIRGVVPLFWDQPGLQTGGRRLNIRLSRELTCCWPAFERHFENGLLHYGPLMCLNLLSSTNREKELNQSFQAVFERLSKAYSCDMTLFDFHRVCKGATDYTKLHSILTSTLLPKIQDFITMHGFFAKMDGQIHRKQTGTLRSNCLDCLDRSNRVQSFISLYVLEQLMTFLAIETKPSMVSRFQQVLRMAWGRNGDNMSMLYAGTRALDGKGLKLRDGARSVQRTIVNNFLDASKNDSFELLLFGSGRSGDFGLKVTALLEKNDVIAPLTVRKGMVDRWSQYTTPEKLRVCVGTWNVNGGKLMSSIALKDTTLKDWLHAPYCDGTAKKYPEEFKGKYPDVYAIGFQELVDLTATNIVNARSEHRNAWEKKMEEILSAKNQYILLTSQQMVGTCLYIFIRPHLISYIRDVCVSMVKTGMSGKTGNKGAVAIRLLIHSTSLCFVCTHLAAHQAKVLERNQDYIDICTKVQFPHGQSLESHDYIFWCGDLNYRIELKGETAKEHITNKTFDRLEKYDQLHMQKKLNRAFTAFIEGRLNFAPTYKYDQFSDDYDTSEKCRVPAWCDRVLWRRKPYVFDSDRHGLVAQLTRVSSSRIAMATSASSSTLDDSERPSSSSPPPSWDLGLHPTDAAKIYGRELEGGGGGGDLVSTSHPWSPGRLLYYNRAELKLSDHRPVLAVIEVDVYRIDEKKRKKLREEIGASLGPLDATISVSKREEEEQEEGEEEEEEEEEKERVFMEAVLEEAKKFGEVILVRDIVMATLITFRDSTAAVRATAMDGRMVNGVSLIVKLKTPWPQKEEEMWREAKARRSIIARELEEETEEGEEEEERKAEKQEPIHELDENGEILEFSFVEDPITVGEVVEASGDGLEQRLDDMELDPDDDVIEEEEEEVPEALASSSSEDEEEEEEEEKDGGITMHISETAEMKQEGEGEEKTGLQLLVRSATPEGDLATEAEREPRVPRPPAPPRPSAPPRPRSPSPHRLKAVTSESSLANEVAKKPARPSRPPPPSSRPRGSSSPISPAMLTPHPSPSPSPQPPLTNIIRNPFPSEPPKRPDTNKRAPPARPLRPPNRPPPPGQ